MRINYREGWLGNGLRIGTVEVPHVDSVAIGVWVGVGGRSETRRASGVSHFIEHLLFKGTRKRSALEISQAIEGRGGYFNAFTQEELTCYYARISAEHLPETWGILADMYANPKFAATDIEKEKGVILEEISMYRDQPHHLVQEMLGTLMWTDHPLGQPLAGSPETVRALDRAAILGFKERYYRPRNTFVVIAGNWKHDDCLPLGEKWMGRQTARAVPAVVPVTRRTRQEPFAMALRKIEQTHLAMGLRIFGRSDPRRYALKMLGVILGENMSSRLFQSVRERHGLAYAIHSGAQLYHDTGGLYVSAGLDRKRAPKAFALIRRELDKLKQQPVGVAELRRAKDYAVGQIKIGLESTTSQMMWAGDQVMSFGHVIQPEEIIRRLETVTREDIQQLARDILKPQSASVALVAPEGEEKLEADAREILLG